MNLIGNLIMNIYSILILIVILYQLSNKDKQVNPTYTIFIALIKVTIFMLIIDITSRFDGNYGMTYVLLNHVSNFLVFAFNLLIPSLWLLYIHYHIYPEINTSKKLVYGLAGLNLINIIALIISYPFGWIYYIDSNNFYHRGPYYFVTILVTIVMVISSFIIIYKNKNKIEKKHYFALQFFAVPPLIGMILQTLSFSIPITLNMMVISIFLVFLNIQRNILYTDYLTGVGNRNIFELELENRINKSNKERTIAGIMIDIDDFKLINDRFGHDVGDQALIDLAEILVSSIRYNDVLARVGGDEFFIILDVATEDKLDLIVNRIKNSTNSFNESSGKPYKLKFSMGYDIYDYKTKMTAEEFRKNIDILMYKNKHAKEDLTINSTLIE